MDQLSSAVGLTQLIDCRSLETQPVPLPSGTAVVVMDTGTRRGLVDSAYNERRQQTSQAVDFFGVPALRDVSPEMLEQQFSALDPVIAIRARHVVTENQRVIQAQKAMQNDDPETFGILMVDSHNSLRDDYEVSSPALDKMVAFALNHPACYGARMTGAGFGGCAVALVKAQEIENFNDTVVLQYQQATGNQPSLYACHPAPGASIEFVE
jgi:galactokinase